MIKIHLYLFYWIQDQIKQDHLHVFRKAGMSNLREHFTKHQSLHKNGKVQPMYLHTEATAEKYSTRVCSIFAET